MKKYIKILLLVICAVGVSPLFAQKIDDFSDDERDFFSSTNGATSNSNAPEESFPGEPSFPVDDPEPSFDAPVADVETGFEIPTEEPSFDSFDNESVVESELEAPKEIVEEIEISKDSNFEANEDVSFNDFEDEPKFEEPVFEEPEEEELVAEEPVIPVVPPVAEAPVVAPVVVIPSPVEVVETPEAIADDYSTYNASNDEVDISLSDMFDDEPLTNPRDSFNNAGSSQNIGANDSFFEASPSPVANNRSYDNPNDTYEQRLHKRYKNLVPVDAGQWAQLIGEKETYVVQRGDTLWELSSTFFGDPHFWTKIWSVNSDIRNPHLIYPGQNINFILGDSNGVPLFTAGNVNSDKIITNSKKKSRSLFAKPTTIPDSFPKWESSLSSNFTAFKGKAIKFNNKGLRAMSDLHSYISQDSPNDIGRIVKIEQDAKMASVFQYLFIGVKPGTVSVNDRLTVVENRGRLSMPKSLKVKSYQFRTSGQIQVVKQVYPKSKKIDPKLEYFRAIVEKSSSPISLSSYVVKKEFPRYSLEDSGLTGTAKGRLIGAEYSKSRHLYGLNSVVFISGGANNGFSVNQTYPVYSKNLAQFKSFDTPTAKVKIIDVEANVATAVILDAKDGVSTGDYIGIQ